MSQNDSGKSNSEQAAMDGWLSIKKMVNSSTAPEQPSEENVGETDPENLN